MSFAFKIKFPNETFVDYGHLVREVYSTEQNLFDPATLKWVQDKRTYTLAWHSTLVNKLSTASASALIELQVEEGGTRVFTGFIMPIDSIVYADTKLTFDVECVDRSILLDKAIGYTVEVFQGWLFNPSTPSISIINLLVANALQSVTVNSPTMAGTYGSLYSDSNVWVPYFIADSSANLLDTLKQVCFENLYSFYFDANGTLQLIPIASSGTATYTFSEAALNIIDGSLSQNRETISQDSLRVTYREIQSLSRVGLTGKNVSSFGSKKVNSSYYPVASKDCDPKKVSRTTYGKVILQTETDTGKKILAWTLPKISLYGWHHYTIPGDRTTDRRNSFKVEYDNGVTTYSDPNGIYYNPPTALPVISNVVLTGNILTFTLYLGTWQKNDDEEFMINNLGCSFTATVFSDTDEVYDLQGSRQDYLDVNLEFGSQVEQAENLAEWYKSMIIDRPFTFSIDSYVSVNLGTFVNIQYPSKGISTSGIITKKSYNRKTREYSYVIKQTSSITFKSPIENLGTVASYGQSLYDPVSGVIDLSNGQLIRPIEASFMGNVADSPKAQSGLYFGADTFGYYDAPTDSWKTRVNADGTATFSGDIATGGAIKSSNYVQGSTGFILRHDGTAELNSLSINVDLSSNNYVAGLAGFKMDKATGSAEFNDAIVRGTITSSAGLIGGWIIGASSLLSGTGSSTVGIDSGGTNPAFYAGSSTPSSAPFRVSKAGLLTASNADITGSIVSSSGTIGGWTIAATTLTGTNIILDKTGKVTLGSGSSTVALQQGVGIWAGNASFASASFKVSATGTLTATGADIHGSINSESGTIGGWTIGANTLESGASGQARIKLDTINNRLGVLTSGNFDVVAMGYLGGLLKNGLPYDPGRAYVYGELVNYNGITYKCSTATTPGTLPTNTDYWSISTDTWTSSEYGFWAKQGQKLTIDGDVDLVNGDWIVRTDANLLFKQGTYVVTRLGIMAGTNGLWFNESPADVYTFRAKLTPSDFHVGNDFNSYIKFYKKNVTFQTYAFDATLEEVNIDATSTKIFGDIYTSVTGTIDAMDGPLHIYSNSASAQLEHTNQINIGQSGKYLQVNKDYYYFSGNIPVSIASTAQYGNPSSAALTVQGDILCGNNIIALGRISTTNIAGGRVDAATYGFGSSSEVYLETSTGGMGDVFLKDTSKKYIGIDRINGFTLGDTNVGTTVLGSLSIVGLHPFPIGEIYFQLPGQKEPYWYYVGGVQGWKDISAQFAGVFFRVDDINTATGLNTNTLPFDSGTRTYPTPFTTQASQNISHSHSTPNHSHSLSGHTHTVSASGSGATENTRNDANGLTMSTWTHAHNPISTGSMWAASSGASGTNRYSITSGGTLNTSAAELLHRHNFSVSVSGSTGTPSPDSTNTSGAGTSGPSGGTEARPLNVTIRVWKRIS